MIPDHSVSARRVLIAGILLELGVLYLLLRNNSWVYDDNFFLVLAGQEGFTWHWLISTQFQHWDIGMHAAYSLQHAIFFVDYRWGLVVMLGFLGASIYVFERVLSMLVRTRWITIAFALWFGLNVLWLRPLQFWAAGVQYFPYTFFDLLCLYGFLRYYAGGSRRWIVISAGALAAALLFYEKPAYMLIYLALFRVLLMSRDLRPRAVLGEFWRERPIWIAYLAVVAVWGVGYIDSHAYSGSHLGGVSTGQYFAYFRILWLQTLIPALASVRLPASNLDALQILFVVASQIVVLACVAVSVRRKRAAWRAWGFIAFIVLASGALVARSRIIQFGVAIANDPRYLIDFAWLVPLTLCAAFTRGDVLEPTVPDRHARFTLPPVRAVVAVLASASLLAYVGGSIATAAQSQREWAGPQARSWEQHLRSDFARLDRSGTPFVVADNAAPFVIVLPFVSPYNRLSRVLRMYVGPVQVDGPLDGTLMVVASDGTVHRANIEPTAPDGRMGALVGSGQVTFGGGREVGRAGEVCVIADATPVQVQRRLPAPSTVGDAPYYLRLVAKVWQPTSLAVYVDHGVGYPGAPDNSISLHLAHGTSLAWLGPDSPHNVILTIPPRSTVCIGRFDIVTLREAT